MKPTSLLGAVLAFGLAVPAAAADLAFVVVNSDYDRVPDLNGARLDRFFADTLENAGFRVFRGENMTGAEMQRLATEFAAAAEEGERNRLVIVLAGHMAGSASGGWLLGRSADQPNAFGVGATALPLEPLAEVAGTAPGQSVIMIVDSDREIPTGFGLNSGVAPLQAPQGVTVAEGPAQGLVALLRDALLQPGVSYAQAIDRAGRGVTLSGYVSDASGLIPAEAPSDQPQNGPDTGEIAYWSAVRDMGTVEALQAYLDRYPNGKFATDARRMIEDVRNAPLRQAEAIETSLSLSRDARRQIQRNLALIGFDPHGIDGIFGPATRSAIGSWQAANGYDRTTYLTQAQVDRIQSAAEVKAAQLEREAQARREAEERADRAYWRDLGQGQDEASLRAYLKRYPDGIYSEVSRERLRAIEDKRAEQVRREERQAWQDAQRRDTVEAYRDFRRRFPDSVFNDAARARIDELTQDRRNSAEIEAARREEAAVAGNDVTRLLVERRLVQLGFQPGEVDGNFDRNSRRAIRQFQRDQGLPVTGFVTQDTMVRLLAIRLRGSP